MGPSGNRFVENSWLRKFRLLYGKLRQAQKAGGTSPLTGKETLPWFAKAVASEKPGPVLGVRNGVRAATADFGPL